MRHANNVHFYKTLTVLFSGVKPVMQFLKDGFLFFSSFYVGFSTLLYLRPLRFQCVGGCWDDY
jgi:hypothetical protein